jgi:hypothetical protein
MTSLEGVSRFNFPRSRSGLSSPGDLALPEDENISVLLESVNLALRRLQELGKPVQGKGKGREVEIGDEVWDCLNRLTEAMKKAEELRAVVSAEEVIQR